MHSNVFHLQKDHVFDHNRVSPFWLRHSLSIRVFDQQFHFLVPISDKCWQILIYNHKFSLFYFNSQPPFSYIWYSHIRTKWQIHSIWAGGRSKSLVTFPSFVFPIFWYIVFCPNSAHFSTTLRILTKILGIFGNVVRHYIL